MKEKLLAGQPAFGVSVMIPSPQVVEMIGKLGFDWVLIDCEHGTISLESVELMAMAAALSGITPIARPWQNTPEAIMQVMDRGVLGVQVPHVNTAEDARRAVESVKFHPQGKRGLAAGTRPASYGLGLSMAEYTVEANRETLVCVQLEEEEALHNLESILQVEGVDVFFIGPSDLSQSMGYPGRSDAPPVREAMDQAFAAIVAAGKVSGSAGNPQAIRTYRQKGVRYLYTHLTTLLSRASTMFFESVRD
ncbi:MAG: 2-dehydro-3-deoxyglucarate aldolase [Nitrospinota bacterium]|nr:MAG: 2-dehydro-3-deoxyglucarate aldolase [Nitrospinota bacterium]